ncbi:band 3 anion transport protein-like isoform X3 [Apostichopus japonicus]
MAHSIDHEEIGKLLTPSISQLGGIQQRITTPPQRRHSDIPTGPNEEIQEGGMNPRDGEIDKRRPKSFHTSRHRIRFKDEEEEDDDDEEDTSPDETSKLREDFDDNDEVMNQGEIINPEEDEDFPHQNPRSESIKSSSCYPQRTMSAPNVMSIKLPKSRQRRNGILHINLRKKDLPSSSKRHVHMQLGSVPEEGRDSHSESMKGEMAESFPNGSTPEFKTNGTDGQKGRRSAVSMEASPMPTDDRRRVLFEAPLDPHELFVQLNEWQPSDPQDFYSDRHWKEKSRWIKFEEDWEQGAEKWGKPHVAHLTFHSLPELRRFLENGLVLLNREETSLTDLIESVLDNLQDEDLIQSSDRETLDPILFQIGKSHMSSRPRTLRASMRRLSVMADKRKPPAFTGQRVYSDSVNSEDIKISILSRSSSASVDAHVEQAKTAQSHLMKKIPANSEAAAILVAQDENIDVSTLALVRMLDSQVFDGFLEVPIPLRFLCFFIGPVFSQHDFHEMGRAMGTLFSDELFRDSAYTARDKDDILTGINGFLNDTMVLPPGEWDRDLLLPITRIQKKENEKVQLRRKSMKPSKDELEGLLKVPDSQEKLYLMDPLKRTGQPFGGLLNDVRRRLPQYWSDIRDGLNFHCLATFFFVFLACVAPAITFGGILGEKTDNWMGLVEMMLSTSVCGMVFSIASGQPLMIIGGTGPVLIFEEYLYKFCENVHVELLPFRACIGIWVFIIAAVVVALEGSTLVKYFTRFTEEILAALISFIFIYETFDGLKHIFVSDPILEDYCQDEYSNQTNYTHKEDYYFDTSTSNEIFSDIRNHSKLLSSYDQPSSPGSQVDSCSHKSHPPQPNVALMSLILTLGTFFIAYFLRIFRYSRFLHREVRRALGDFGIAIAIFTMVLVDAAAKNTGSQKVCIPGSLRPTKRGRDSWFVNPFGLKDTTPIFAIFGAAIPAFLLFILLYMETLLTGMLVSKKEHKLKKGTGFHLDLFLMGVLSAVAGLFGVPWMCAATVRTVSHLQSLSVMTRKNPPGVRPKLDYIIDQRLTNFLVSFCIGLLAFTSNLLENIPIPVLLGVFMYLGISSLSGLSLTERIKIFFMPSKHHPDAEFIRTVKLWKIHIFTLIQVICLAVLWAVKNSDIAIAFPFFLILLVVFRHCLKFFIFNDMDLEALDSEDEDEVVISEEQ